ncbi:MAG: hypothetical protein R2701_00890 [Acidimicrobiales bacterium]
MTWSGDAAGAAAAGAAGAGAWWGGARRPPAAAPRLRVGGLHRRLLLTAGDVARDRRGGARR